MSEIPERPQIPAPRPGRKPAAPKPDAAKRKADVQKAAVHFAVGSIGTVVVAILFFKLGILSKTAALVAAVMQIIAFLIYFVSSDAMAAQRIGDKPQARDVLGPERRAARRRTGLRFVTLLMLAFLAVASFQRFEVLGYPPPWKVTDPTSRLFNPEKFKFGDYRTPNDIQRAAQLIFTPGTPKTVVDKILHDSGHATVKLSDQGLSTKIYTYTYSSSADRPFLTGVFAWVMGNPEADRLWFVVVRCDDAGRVVNVSATAQNDQSGALPYTQMTPIGTTSPYAPPSALQMKP